MLCLVKLPMIHASRAKLSRVSKSLLLTGCHFNISMIHGSLGCDLLLHRNVTQPRDSWAWNSRELATLFTLSEIRASDGDRTTEPTIDGQSADHHTYTITPSIPPPHGWSSCTEFVGCYLDIPSLNLALSPDVPGLLDTLSQNCWSLQPFSQ